MMTNLYSVFDPSTTFNNMSLNWISTTLGLLWIATSFLLIPSRPSILWVKMLLNLHKEFKTLIGFKSINKGSTFIFISLFSIIMFNNFLGLFHYMFTSSSHMVMTFLEH